MFEKFLRETLKMAPRQVWGVEQLGVYFKKLFSAKGAKAVIACVVAIAECIGLAILDLPTTPRGDELDLTGYTLVFEDEFDGNELDTSVWRYRGSGKWRGGYSAESQVTVKDGNLIIKAEYLDNGQFGEGWYSGRVSLKEYYCKGYFEIRCKVNAGSGFWSAFWIQADHPYEAAYSKGGVGGCEIDIFEAMGWDSPLERDSITQTVHCAGVDGVQEGFQSYMLGSFYGNNIHEEYNTYGLKWTDEEYIFYVNGVETRRTSFGNGVSEVPEEVIVSLETPTEDKLEPLDKASYSTEYIVDYVKIYQPTLTSVD
ncbi:MAG: glycoside hydrolase family 16 protein [Clostridia bacterium]|nr:glycoside hydrolase family 16 protein [Clostridia bacterium]